MIKVIDSFDANEAASIAEAQEVFRCDHLAQDLAFISSHFSKLPKIIKQLETLGLPLSESTHIASNFIEELYLVPGLCGNKMKIKIQNVVKRNPDIEEIFQIGKIMRHETISSLMTVPFTLWSKYKNAPITSCDVERSFSAYKLILTDKRHQFTPENLEKNIVIYCYLNYNNDILN